MVLNKYIDRYGQRSSKILIKECKCRYLQFMGRASFSTDLHIMSGPVSCHLSDYQLSRFRQKRRSGALNSTIIHLCLSPLDYCCGYLYPAIYAVQDKGIPNQPLKSYAEIREEGTITWPVYAGLEAPHMLLLYLVRGEGHSKPSS